MMKTIRNFALCATVLLVLTAGCKKETGEKVEVTFDVVIAPETHKADDGTKVYLDNSLYPNWNSGDPIHVNDGDGTVTPISGDETRGTFTASITAPSDNHYYAVFPASIANGIDLHSVQQVKMPRVQEYETTTVGGVTKQKITSPMFAYNERQATLQFHNLCGMMAITITNDKAWDMVLDSIQVEATTKKLNGTMDITNPTSATPIVYAINETVDSFDVAKREKHIVSLSLANVHTELESTRLHEGSTNASITLYVYLPVIENSNHELHGINDNLFYIRVFSHPKWSDGADNEVHISYEMRQSNSAYAYMSRNSIVPVALKLNDCKPTFTSLKPFTISSGTQVSISRGNTQYYIKTYDATQADCQPDNTYRGTGYWAFAPRQWDFLYTPSLHHSDYTTGKWIEHFTWGSGDKPTHHFHSGQSGSGANTDFNTWNQDWGYNYTHVTTNSTWRTLTQPEWDHLLKVRTTVNNDNKWCFGWVTLDSITNGRSYNGTSVLYGIMVIPDGVDVNAANKSTTRTKLGISNAFKAYDHAPAWYDVLPYEIAFRYRWDNGPIGPWAFEYYEALGCIFIPCIGVYGETGLGNTLDMWDANSPEGGYWSKTHHNVADGGNDSYFLGLEADVSTHANCRTGNDNINDAEDYRHLCVRLVRPYVSGGNTYKYDPFQ